MAQKQVSPASVTESVAMDTRKFLSAINNSAQSQITFFEDAIKKLGEKYGKNWTLTALQANRVYFEDTDNKEYFIAEHSKEKGGRIKIAGLKKIQLHEDKKPELFENSCYNLVEAIEKNDSKEIDSAFNKIAANRFRSTTIPSTGVVKTKDGKIRQIAVDENQNRNLADRIVECLSDRIVINEDGKAEASFTTDDFSDVRKLGVSELTTRRLVAKYMQETAMEAYNSNNFQTLVEGIAGLITKDELEKAIKLSGQFLKEHQEFCLLNEYEWNTLIENTLATRAVFNQNLAEDTATLLRKTNLKVNKEDLLEAWRKTAERAQHPVMLENIGNLSEAVNFEEAYNGFLSTILEVSNETAKGALIAGLEMLKQKVGSGDIDDSTVGDLDEIIQDLRTKGDSASTWKAMETLDGVRRGIENLKGMEDFDSMPGPMDEEDIPPVTEPETTPEASKETSDKPLEISIKLDPMKMAGQQAAEVEGGFDLDSLDDIEIEGDVDELDTEPEADLDPEPKGEEDDLDELLSAGKEPEGDAISEDEIRDFLKNEFSGDVPEKAELVKESSEKKSKKSKKSDEERLDELADDIDEELDADTDEDDDEYALPEGFELESVDPNYKTVEESDFADSDIIEFDNEMRDAQNTDDPDTLQASAEAFVRQKRASELDNLDPKQQKEKVIDLAGKLVAKRQEARQENIDKSNEDKLEENQFKTPIAQLSRRGLKRSAVLKLVEEGNFQWIKKEDNAVLGEFKNVKFVVDHSEQPPAILSEDGNVVINIPAEFVPGAMYMTGASDDEADSEDFVQWLDSVIGSLEVSPDETVDNEISKVSPEVDDSEHLSGDDEVVLAEPDFDKVPESDSEEDEIDVIASGIEDTEEIEDAEDEDAEETEK